MRVADPATCASAITGASEGGRAAYTTMSPMPVE